MCSILPKELRNINLIYHSTSFVSFSKILKSDSLHGTKLYDSGIATSRNRFYVYGHDDSGVNCNCGEIQFILDRNKIQYNYKLKAFAFPFYWEGIEFNKTISGKHSVLNQSEDKIKVDRLDNIHKYIIGLHIVKNDTLNKILKTKYNLFIKKCIKDNNWIIFDEDWNDISIIFL